MDEPRKVALLIETSNSYARGILHGIIGYVREHHPWSLSLSEFSRGASPPAWLRRWNGHGVIARIENKILARAMAGFRVPVVDLSSARKMASPPWIKTNDITIARFAFEHLSERGFKSFGYCGDDGFKWSIERSKQFENLCRQAGRSCSLYRPLARRITDMEAEIENIAKWVDKLSKPVGIMASYDFRGRQVLAACQRRGVVVPDEAAVIGVDNDELLCDLSDPSLSSVIPDTYRTGYEAAALLDRMMNGEVVAPKAHLIDPLGVATRQSTDTLAIEDKRIVAVVRYIRERACEGIGVKDILHAMPQSRRLLESRFKKLIGRTVHDEITRVQINRVKLLLTESSLSLEEIAERTGFAHVEYLSVVFHKKVGQPPGRYRALNRRPSPAR